MTIDGIANRRIGPTAWLRAYFAVYLLSACPLAAVASDFESMGAASRANVISSTPWQPPASAEPMALDEIAPVIDAPSEAWQPPTEPPVESPIESPVESPLEPIATPADATNEQPAEHLIEPSHEPIPTIDKDDDQADIESDVETNQESWERTAEAAAPANTPVDAEAGEDVGLTAEASLLTANEAQPVANSNNSNSNNLEKPENQDYLAALNADWSHGFEPNATASNPVAIGKQALTREQALTGEQMPATGEPAPAFVYQEPAVAPYSPTTAELTRQLLPSIQHAYGLARNGAIFAARTEFIQVLRRIAQSKDAATGLDVHSQSLAAGLRALDEADDFTPQGAQLEGEMDVTLVSAAHRTPVLQQRTTPPRPIEAIALYHEYARHQLARAVAGEQAGSAALYGLGKMHNRLANAARGEVSDERKALVMFLAALDAAPGNHLAANEVGVLFARGGRPWEASIMFRHAIDVAPSSTGYHNLATVDRQLGYHDQANANESYAQQLAMRDRIAGAASRNRGVEWVAPQDMSRMAQPLPVEANQHAANQHGANQQWASQMAPANRQQPQRHPSAVGAPQSAAPLRQAAQWPQKLVPGIFRR